MEGLQDPHWAVLSPLGNNGGELQSGLARSNKDLTVLPPSGILSLPGSLFE